MALSYILKQVGKKMGLNPSDSLQRATLLVRVNEAARKLYVKGDLPGTLQEQAFKINGDQTVTLPYYVGPIRGLRELGSMQSWHINLMRPRYNQFNWPDQWRNYRLKNKQCLQNSVVNQSVAVIIVPTIEDPPITVTVTGPTDNASLATESIVMDSASIINEDGTFSKQTVKNYNDYTSVTKDRVNDYDVTLTDIDARVLTIIPNTQVEAQYQIIDVSSCPWLAQNITSLDNYMEIMFKLAMFELSKDTDQFPAMFNYDDAVVDFTMKLWMIEQGKADRASLYHTEAIQGIADQKEDQDRASEDMIALAAHPHDTMLKRIGTGLRRRYSLYAGRKF